MFSRYHFLVTLLTIFINGGRLIFYLFFYLRGNETKMPCSKAIFIFFSILSMQMRLQPWSQGLENFILYAFCPSPPLCNVDKTLSSNKSLHFPIIFPTLKGGMGVPTLIQLALRL